MLCFIAFLIPILGVFGELKAEWTQYSDSASLPMSKQYRDQLRDRINKIDMNTLSGEERANIERLKNALREDDFYDYSDISSWATYPVLTAAIVVLALFFVYIKKRYPAALHIPDPDEIRAARLAKYE